MPDTRKANYYFGCLDSSVFIDFNESTENKIQLIRISFDGYGCCELNKRAVFLNQEESQQFIITIKSDPLDQEMMAVLVKKSIQINKEFIWIDALEEYGLIEKGS